MVKANLKIFSLAGKLAEELLLRIRKFPPSEQYMMIPVMRDCMYTFLENIAYGMAEYHPIDRFRFLVRAMTTLEEINSRVALCHQLGLFSDSDVDILNVYYKNVKIDLRKYIESIQSAVQNLPPSSVW